MVEKEKAKEKEQGSKEDKTNKKTIPADDSEGLFKDSFEKGWVKENWEEKENLYARVSKNKLDSELGKGLILDGMPKENL